MGSEGIIQLYTNGFWISLAVTVLGAAGAVASFFLFDIRTVFAIRTGKAEKASVQKLAAKNMETGRLREDYSFDYNTMTMGRKTKRTMTTGRMKTTPTAEEKMQPVAETTQLVQKIPAEKKAAASALPSAETQLASAATAAGFTITEKIMIIHTDEVIS